MSAVTMTAATFLVFRSVRADRDAVALEDVGDDVQGAVGVAVAVPRQAGHHAVADQLVVAAALDHGDVLDAGRPRGAGDAGGEEEAEGGALELPSMAEGDGRSDRAAAFRRPC